MPRPERLQRVQSTPQREVRAQPVSAINIISDIKALSSSLDILSQKIALIEKNEKVLGRNLIVLNQKLKALHEKKATGELPENITELLNEIGKQLLEQQKKVDALSEKVSSLKQEFVSKEEFKELKYVIDSINPLEFVTISQVKDIIKDSLQEKKEKTESKQKK